MKKIIKVAVLKVRKADLQLPTAVTSDNDVFPAHGSEEITYEVKFNNLGDDIAAALEAVKPITDNITSKYCEVGGDAPWFDTTPYREDYSIRLTEQAINLLNEALPQYEFVKPQDEYDLKVLTRKCVKIHISAKIEEKDLTYFAGACADLDVEPYGETGKEERVNLSLTVDMLHSKSTLKRIAQVLQKLDYQSGWPMWVYVRHHGSSEKTESDLEHKWSELIARALTNAFSNLAFVADDTRQPYELVYDTYVPFIRRIFGCKKRIPRLKYLS